MSNFKYFLVYKPFQVLSQFSPVAGKETLADHFELPRDVYPVGRLDYDTEGLLLITNDKALNQQLLDPAKAHIREYYVQVEGEVTDAALQQLSRGVTIQIDGTTHKTLPAKAMRLAGEPELPPRNPPIRFRQRIPTSWLSLALHEGKNRQVRRMTAAVGLPTLRLVRWRIGRITAKGMLPGDMVILSQDQLRQVLSKT